MSWSLALLFLAITSTGSAAESSPGIALSRGQQFCTPAETWNWSTQVTRYWKSELNPTLAASTQAPRAFAQAIAFRGIHSTEPELKAISEYWLARAFLNAGFEHLAWHTFESIAASEITPERIPYQLAALGCLTELQTRHPGLKLKPINPEWLSAWKRLDAHPGESATLARYEFYRALQNSEKKPTPQSLALMSEWPAGRSLFEIYWASTTGNHAQVLSQIDSWIGPQAKASLPKELQKHQGRLLLLKARALYSLDRFEESQKVFRSLDRASNDFARSLSDLSWAALMNESYGDAIGAALSLQAGNMRNIFAPEAPMVLAMAYNELCQFPGSLKAIEQFRVQYEPTYHWLDQWSKSNSPLYPQLLGFLKSTKAQPSTVPVRIGTEWIRSPIFISRQEELNGMADWASIKAKHEKNRDTQMGELEKTITQSWDGLKIKIQREKKNLKPGEALPASLRDSIAQLKNQIKLYKRVHLSRGIWEQIAQRNHLQIQEIKQARLKEIETDLRDRTDRMITVLNEVADNNQLIEVEIYEGATKDLIWQNAHPDYADAVKKLSQTGEAKKADQAAVWDWGRAPASKTTDAPTEVWEDELGNFKVDTADHCSNQKKYLAIKALGRKS
jgi:hypothetical protein